MNRDKQIEEMARVWCPFPHRHDCDGCCKGCYEISKSEMLYNAGYRKASEVIEEVFLALDKRTKDEGLVFIKKSDIGNAIKKKKVEIAREIFEEIESKIATLEYKAKTPRKTVKVEELKAQVNWVLHEVVPNTIAELQKKYESEGDK